MIVHLYTNTFRKILATLTVCVFTFAPLTNTLSVQRATAQFAVYDVANHIVNSATAANTAAVSLKDTAGDGLAWAAVNILIEEMLQSTIDWVNSGFEGKPTFVQDFKAFALDVGDRYALDFIWDNNLVDLCSPFRLNVQLALEVQYASSREYYAGCRLSEAIKNIKNLTDFHDGNFIAAGGWDAWYAVTTDRQMYADGALLESRIALTSGVSNARGQSLFEAGVVGNGFLSKKVCEDEEAQTGCVIQTPGSVIEGYLNSALSTQNQRLAVADELNELFGALIGQLAGNILGGGGSGGLSGARSGGSSRAQSYFDSIRTTPTQPYVPPATVAVPGGTNTTGDTLTDSYLGLLQEASERISSCDGEVPPNAEGEMNSRQSWLLTEIQDVLFGRKTVTLVDINAFNEEILPDIDEMIEQLPGTAQCDI